MQRLETPTPPLVEIRPWAVALVLTLHGGLLAFLWSHGDLWAECAASIPFLSMTGVASLASLSMALALVRCTTRLRWRDLGLVPHQLGLALAVAVLVGLATQLAHLLDARWFGEVAPDKVDLSGATLSAYAEEFVFRLVVISGATRLAATRVGARAALIFGVVISMALFAASHVPHDLAVGELLEPGRYLLFLGYGALMALVWLATRNLLLAALIHALSNQPPLAIAGVHRDMVTSDVNWAACGAVILIAAWVRLRAAPVPTAAPLPRVTR